MENHFFRCTQRAITQRRVITLGPIFIKMVLNRAQGLKEKSQEVSARKNNNRQRYNKKCRRGGADSAPPALLGLKHRISKCSMMSEWHQLFCMSGHVKSQKQQKYCNYTRLPGLHLCQLDYSEYIYFYRSSMHGFCLA